MVLRGQVFFVGAMLLVAGLWACGSDSDAQDGTVPSSSPTEDASAGDDDSGDNTHPAFEAGFPDSGDAGKSDAADAGPPCNDPDDPGSTEQTAKVLTATSDAQNDAITVNGTLDGPVDIDMYELAVADTTFHLLQPDIEMKTPAVEMCTFVKCPDGSSSDVSCPSGSVATKSDIGTDGCCVTGPSTSSLSTTWNCSGTDDSATLFFRIEHTANACTPYSFTYAF